MGKATRWLKGLLGMKKDKENVENFPKFKERKENKRWSFSVSEKHYSESSNIDHSVWLRSLVSETEKEQNKHAIAVAAATAAAADAAAAAAQAAVAVVRLTNQGRLLNGKKEKNAAVKIQAVFRGSLSRKALRALKGLVKLQALVRGYLVRKRAAATLHSMQALFRAQFAVCSQRALLSSNNNNNNNHLKYPSSHFRARRSTEKMEGCRSEHHHRRRLSASIEYDASYGGIDEIPSPKIIGIDTCKHKSRSRRIHTCISDDHHHHHYPIPCPNSARLSIPNYPQLDECCKKFATAQNTPRFMNCGMSEAPVTTPSKSAGGGGDGYFRRYSNYPSYMANTQSFEAKSRSHSAPKQRVEGIPTRKGLSLNEMMASRLSFSGVRMQRPCLQVEEDFNF